MGLNASDSEIFGSEVIRLAEVDSTSQFARSLSLEKKVRSGTAVMAEFQHNGRGQAGTHWQSERGKNLMVSFIIHPEFLLVSEQFQLSKAVALAVRETLQEYIPDVRIKWPNDILSGDHKIAGILIENSLGGNKINQSIIGIGINVNQTDFAAEFKASSIAKIIQKETNKDEVFATLCKQLNHSYFLLQSGKNSLLNDRYLQHLYGIHQWKAYDYLGERISAKIKGVDKNGKLILEVENGSEISADLKEITFFRG